MEIIKEYQRREFCKDRGCPTQNKIDEATDQSTIDTIKEDSCSNCMAHEFHKWLNGKDYQIVKIN
jgi:hypothetical protein